MSQVKRWLYGDSWERFPIEPGEVWGLPDGSKVAVHDVFDPLPAWMRADMIFVDPPWNQGNLTCFYTKANRTDYQRFDRFTDVLFERVSEIGAYTAYVEIGNQFVDEWRERMAQRFSCVQHWPVTYYRKHPTNLLRGSHIGATSFDYTGADEARCIELISEREAHDCIADPCMGRGLVGLAAYRAGKRFVGTELNKRRLAVLLDKLAKQGADVSRVE